MQEYDEYEESALHNNREWIMSVLTAVSGAIDINYHMWCEEERQERLELLMNELENIK